MPENCNECEYTKTCQSHYGGLGCKKWNEHNEQIREPQGSFLVAPAQQEGEECTSM